MSYGYNDVGLRTNMTVTGETAVFYRYDNANRLTNVTQGTFTSALFYDDAGRRTQLTLPNAIKVLYTYDAASRLTNLTYQAAVTNRIDYGYDDVGNRVAQASKLANYLLPAAVTNSSYNFANQQLTFGTYTMQYDANGNVTNIISGATTNKLFWSSRNQLTGVVAAVSAAFQYDGLGRRVARTVSTVQEKYLYDGLDVILQKDSANAVRGRYFRGLGIDEPWLRSDVGTVNTNRTYLADGLGSIVALADTNRVVQTEYDYEPFGATTTTGAGNKNSYKFTAREDDGTGMYYYRARYYHPALGRFVSEDPIEYLASEFNLFAYGGEDPINSTDPHGLFTLPILLPAPPPGSASECSELANFLIEQQQVLESYQRAIGTCKPPVFPFPVGKIADASMVGCFKLPNRFIRSVCLAHERSHLSRILSSFTELACSKNKCQRLDIIAEEEVGAYEHGIQMGERLLEWYCLGGGPGYGWGGAGQWL